MSRSTSLALNLLLLSAALTGCGLSNPDYDNSELHTITQETGTKKQDRTRDWYVKHDFVRNDVLNACSAIQEDVTGVPSLTNKDDFNIYNLEDDCALAREANVLVIKENNKGVMNYYEYDKLNQKYQVQNQKTSNELSDKDLALLKELSNDTNSKIDNYSVGTESPGKDDYKSIQKLVEGEIQQEQQNKNQN